MKREIYRTGRPGKVAGSRIEGFRHGEGMLIYFAARGFNGKPLRNPGAYDAYLTFSDTEGGPPFAEFHSMADDPVTLINPDNSEWLFDLDPTPHLARLQEYGEYHFDFWTSDGKHPPVHQDKGAIRVLPSIESTQTIGTDFATLRGSPVTLRGTQVNIGA